MKNIFKVAVFLLIILITFISYDQLTSEEDLNCSECVSVQIHSCEALGVTNGRLDLAGETVQKVKDACGSLGSSKVTEVHTKWLNATTENCNIEY